MTNDHEGGFVSTFTDTVVFLRPTIRLLTASAPSCLWGYPTTSIDVWLLRVFEPGPFRTGVGYSNYSTNALTFTWRHSSYCLHTPRQFVAPFLSFRARLIDWDSACQKSQFCWEKNYRYFNWIKFHWTKTIKTFLQQYDLKKSVSFRF